MLDLKRLRARLVDDVLRAIHTASVDELLDGDVVRDTSKVASRAASRPHKRSQGTTHQQRPTAPEPARRPRSKRPKAKAKPGKLTKRRKRKPTPPPTREAQRTTPTARPKAKAKPKSTPKPRSHHLAEITDPERLLAGPAAPVEEKPREPVLVLGTGVTESTTTPVVKAGAGLRVGDARPGVIRRLKKT